jgi:S-formylglutathione hydrolase FrmB
MVAPDINGSVTGDTECVGAAETYLTVDVRDFMHSRFGVALSRQEWALAGMSEGGTCALVLTTTHPDLFGSFADFMGDEAPSVGTFHHTLVALFGGSYDAWLAHDPTTWFGRDAADGLEGYIAVGSRDRGYFKRERRVAEMARADHLVVTFEIIRGGTHSWPTASHAMRDAYPWLVARVEGAELTRA